MPKKQEIKQEIKYIIPYYKIESKKGISQSFELQRVWVFMRGKGKTLWKIESEDQNKSQEWIINEYLLSNGFAGSGKLIDSTLYYQMSSIDWNSWYTIYDETEEEDVWRPFFHVPEAGWETIKTFPFLSICGLGD